MVMIGDGTSVQTTHDPRLWGTFIEEMMHNHLFFESVIFTSISIRMTSIERIKSGLKDAACD